MSDEKHIEASKAWRLRNLDAVSARQKAYREANKERLSAYQKQYRELHREKRAAYMKAYMAINGQKYSRNRRERKSYYKPRPKDAQVPRDLLPIGNKLSPMGDIRAFSMTIPCSFCDRKVRRGSEAYYDGKLDLGDWSCSECTERLKLEA